MLQWFGFAGANERFSLAFANQFVDPLRYFPVPFLPIQVVFPCLISEDQLHLASFRPTPLPAFSCAAAARRRFAFAGVRNRAARSLPILKPALRKPMATLHLLPKRFRGN